MAKHSMGRCRVCENYLRGIEQCKFCNFEWAIDYPPTNERYFDIFELDDDVEWVHLQLMDRLKYMGIDCLSVDMWADNNLAYIIGANADAHKVAEALNVHDECVYNCGEHPLFIVNLFQEKYLRGELE